MSIADWIALTALALNLIGVLVGLTWGVAQIAGKVERRLHKDFETYKTSLQGKVDTLEEVAAAKELAMERRVGEVSNALRNKIQEVELWTRDNFVNDKNFQVLLRMLTDRLDQLQRGIDRLNSKREEEG